MQRNPQHEIGWNFLSTASLSALFVLKRLSKTWIFHHDHARKRKHEFKILVRYHVVKYLNRECDKLDNDTFIFSSSRENSQAQKDISSAATSSVEVAMVTEVKCRVCGVPADARFDPCGHVIACVDCATMLKKCFLCKVKGFYLMPYIVVYLQIRKLLVMKRRPTFPLLLRRLARSLKDSLLQLTIFESPMIHSLRPPNLAKVLFSNALENL